LWDCNIFFKSCQHDDAKAVVKRRKTGCGFLGGLRFAAGMLTIVTELLIYCMNGPFEIGEYVADGCRPVAEWFDGLAAVTEAQGAASTKGKQTT
jgi:hypothetical protein